VAENNKRCPQGCHAGPHRRRREGKAGGRRSDNMVGRNNRGGLNKGELSSLSPTEGVKRERTNEKQAFWPFLNNFIR